MPRQADFDPPPHIQDALDALSEKAAAKKRKAKTKVQARPLVSGVAVGAACGGVPRGGRARSSRLAATLAGWGG